MLEPHEDLVELGLLLHEGRRMTGTWVDGAAGSPYDVDNLPYGVFSAAGDEPAGRRAASATT